MRYPKKSPLVLREREQTLLEQLAHSRTESHRCVIRATLILRLAAGETKAVIARELHLTRRVIYSWYDRWLEAQSKLSEADDMSEPEFRQLMKDILTDRPRAGAPLHFTAEQLCQLTALACQNPEGLGLPFTTWTPAELARVAIERQIVGSISPSTVGRFLKSGRFTTA